MFASISLKNLDKSKMFSYAAELPFFKDRKSIDFKPGLNILFGGNGSGKSTVLRILAETMCAYQGGMSVVTENVLRETIDSPFKGTPTDAIGLSVKHDGQPVVHSDPRKLVGLVGGSFDDDFMHHGLQESMNSKRASHGQNVLRRGSLGILVIQGQQEFPKEIIRKVTAKGVNDHFAQRLAIVEKRMVGKIPKGQPSLLLDEPEVSFSIDWQHKLWSHFHKAAKDNKLQLIIATHSVFALGIPEANYIEVEQGSIVNATAAFLAKANAIMAQP